MPEILGHLGDPASRVDYLSAVSAEPQVLWRHWIRRLFNGIEYLDYIALGPGNVVLNAGVHGGGEIPYFLSSMAGQGTIVNIDPLGHAYLLDYVRAVLADSSVAQHEVCAVLSDSPGQLEMMIEPGGMAADVVHAQRDSEVRTFRATTIDEITDELGLQRLDLIKMDIEGAELHALAGAWDSIQRFRPQLAISIYHQPEHFFRIPLELIHRLHDYRFFIRNYHFISNETIIYAIPKERAYRVRSNKIDVWLS